MEAAFDTNCELCTARAKATQRRRTWLIAHELTDGDLHEYERSQRPANYLASSDATIAVPWWRHPVWLWKLIDARRVFYIDVFWNRVSQRPSTPPRRADSSGGDLPWELREAVDE